LAKSQVSDEVFSFLTKQSLDMTSTTFQFKPGIEIANPWFFKLSLALTSGLQTSLWNPMRRKTLKRLQISLWDHDF